MLHAAVIHITFLQQAFWTVGLSRGDRLCCTAAGALWLREPSHVAARAKRRSSRSV